MLKLASGLTKKDLSSSIGRVGGSFAMNKQEQHGGHPPNEGLPDKEQQASPTIGKVAALSSKEAGEEEGGSDAEKKEKSKLPQAPQPTIAFASLGSPIATSRPFEAEPPTTVEQTEDGRPAKRRSHSDPTPMSIRNLGLGRELTIPLELEREIVSRLALDFQGRDTSLATSSEGSSAMDSMENLLERLGNLFPENQDDKADKSNSACCICKNQSIFYPYQLADCGHVACGRCIYTTGVATCGEAMKGHCQLCGIPIRSQPKRVDNFQQYHAKSQWTLAHDDFSGLLKKNEKRVHHGRAGSFAGLNTGEEGLEPFEGIGYAGTFDRLPLLDIASTTQAITLPRTDLRLTHCPAHHNFSPFPMVTFSHLRTPSKLMPFFHAVKHLYRDDIYLLEKDDETHFLTHPDRFTVRLTGWEHLATESSSDSSPSSASRKRKRKEERKRKGTITWRRGGMGDPTVDS